VVVVCLVVVTGLLAAVPAGAATVRPRIIGGGDITIADAPWQVAIVTHQGSAENTQFCGGVIVSARRIITAAHCLDFNGDGLVDAAGTRDIVAGITDLSDPTAPPVQRVQIEAWAPMPGFDLTSDVPGRDDVAVATLKAPGLDLSGPDAQPAALVPSGQLTPAGTTVRVSGWGATAQNPDEYPFVLQSVDLLTVSDESCATDYGPDLDPATMLCAGAPGKDSCSGDSGGPLALTDGTAIGLVSWGPDPCADPGGAPGVYTELAEPSIAAFIRAPQSLTAPGLTGTAKSGEQLTCHPGSWASTSAGSPAIDFSFATSDGVVLRDWSPETTYTLGDGDAGRRVVCVERITDPSGSSTAASVASAPVVGPPVTPTPTPTPTGTQPGPGTAPTPTAKPADTVAPRTTFLSARCVKRRCVVRLRVADRGATISGVKTVRVTLLPVRGKSRTVSAKRIASGIYQATFTRVPRGTTWFTVATRDIAGNRSPTPAIKHVRVR